MNRTRQRMLRATGKLADREPDPASRFNDGVAVDLHLKVGLADRLRVLLGAGLRTRCLVRTEYHPGRTRVDQHAVLVAWGDTWADWLGWALWQPAEWLAVRPADRLTGWSRAALGALARNVPRGTSREG